MNSIRYIILLIVFIAGTVQSEDKKIAIGIDEQLGKKIPLDVYFNDENGERVQLKDLFTKPTVLSFVYYECPGICTPLMNSLSEVVEKSDLIPGEDYNIVSISIDERENPALALKKKNNYLKMMEKDLPPFAWKFLTGDSISIHTVTDAAGFYFKREGKDFIHSGALIFITKDGMISRYLFPDYSERKGNFGILPFDFKMAVLETSEGKTSPTIARMLQFCFKYDPEGRTYVLNLTQIFGTSIFLITIVLVVVLSRKPKKNKQNEVNVNGK